MQAVSSSISRAAYQRAGVRLQAYAIRPVSSSSRRLQVRAFSLKPSAPDSKDPILLELDGTKAVLTLNNAKIANAIDVDLQISLIDHLEALSTHKQTRSIIITGRGKYFCSGMNLGNKGESLAGNNEEQHDRLIRLFKAVSENKKPVIGVINGPCYGGGNGLAMATDIRIAAHPDVTFTMSETRLGVVPAVISKYMVREWGIAKAREAMILARAVKCQELLPVGGVHHITQNQEEAMKLAYELADQLAGNAPGAINNAKEICKTAAEQIEATHDARAKEAFLEFAAPSKEAQFGIQAFREKRKADWSQLE